MHQELTSFSKLSVNTAILSRREYRINNNPSSEILHNLYKYQKNQKTKRVKGTVVEIRSRAPVGKINIEARHLNNGVRKNPRAK